MDTSPHPRAPLPVLVAILAIGAFTTALNVTMLTPLLTAIAADFHVSTSAAGQLATVTATCSALTGLAIAPVLDRYPRGHVLGIEAALLGTGTVVTALAPTFGWLFVGRILAGIGGAIIFGISLAAIGDIFTEPNMRNRMIGFVGTAGTLGAILGLPLITELRAWLGWRWAVAAMLPFASVLLAGTFLFPRTISVPPSGHLWAAWRSGYATVGRSRASVLLLAAVVSVALIWFGWLIYFAAYSEHTFQTSARMLSIVFLAGGLGEAVTNNIVPPLLRRFPARTVITASGCVVSANLLASGPLYRYSWTLFAFFIIGSMAITVLFFAVGISLLDSLPHARGALMALQSAGFDFGGALGAGVTGLALSALGSYVAAFMLLGLILPLGFALFSIASRRAAPAAATG